MKKHEWNTKEKKGVNIVSGAPISRGCGSMLNLSLNSPQTSGMQTSLKLSLLLKRKIFLPLLNIYFLQKF